MARQLAGASDHGAAPTQRRTTGPQTTATGTGPVVAAAGIGKLPKTVEPRC